MVQLQVHHQGVVMKSKSKVKLAKKREIKSIADTPEKEAKALFGIKTSDKKG